MAAKNKRRRYRPLFPRPAVSETEIGTTTTESGAPVPGIDEMDQLLSTVPRADENDYRNLDPALACPSDGGPLSLGGRCDYLAGNAESKEQMIGAADQGAGIADEGERSEDLENTPDLIEYGETPSLEKIVRLKKPPTK